jgi:hypothetical protein
MHNRGMVFSVWSARIAAFPNNKRTDGSGVFSAVCTEFI